MPNQDGSGPFGDGRPGRGLGPCGRTDRYPRGGFFRGFRFGWRGGCGGRGRWGWGASDNDNPSYPYEKEALEDEKSRLEKALGWVVERLKEFEK